MSSAQWLGQFTPKGQAPFYFASIKTAGGVLIDTDIFVEEEFTTPGVDGRRWRILYKQFDVSQMTCWEDCTSESEMLLLAKRYGFARTTFGTLVYKFRNATRTWANVHVKNISTQIIPGPLFGFGASASSALAIESHWQFEFTQQSS